MSMHFPNIKHTTATTRCPESDQYLFANAVQARREELGLSIFEAADLSGLAVYQWAAVEEGCWVPENRNVIRSIAGALETNSMQMILLSSLSAWALSGYKTKHPQL